LILQFFVFALPRSALWMQRQIPGQQLG
jgi:hypothetical protein